MRIVVDCAHGAAYHVAPHVFHELGADVETVGVNPDGFNINDGVGATSPQALQAAVKRHKADLGIALDGDGDRLVMVDDAAASSTTATSCSTSSRATASRRASSPAAWSARR